MKTYSFQEVIATFSHPSLGVVNVNGAGIGTLGVSMMSDRATSVVASDGEVVINKIKDRRGTVTIDLQQVSNLNKDLQKWFNYLENASSAEWALITGLITSKSTGEQTTCKYGAITKIADKNYGPEQANISYSLLFADIQNNIV